MYALFSRYRNHFQKFLELPILLGMKNAENFMENISNNLIALCPKELKILMG